MASRTIYPESSLSGVVRTRQRDLTAGSNFEYALEQYPGTYSDIRLNIANPTGTNSPQAYVNTGTTTPNLVSKWTFGSGLNTSSDREHFIDFDIPFTAIGVLPSSVQIRLLMSGDYNSLFDVVPIWIKQPILQFKKVLNPTLPSDIFIASGIAKQEGDYTLNPSGYFNISPSFLTPGTKQGVLNMINFGDSTEIGSGVPGSFPSLSGQIYFKIPGYSDYSDRVWLYEMDLLLDGTPPSSSGTISLHTSAAQPITSGISLYTYGNVLTPSSISLHTWGYTSINSGVDLTLLAYPIVTSGTSLYTYGAAEKTNSITLNIKGLTNPSSSGNISLFTFAYANSGVTKDLSLYLHHADDYPDPLNSLPLVISGPTSLPVSGSMPLFLYYDNTSTNYISMYVSNQYTNISSGLSLYITTPSGTDGYIPYSSIMPLYLERIEAVGNGLSLHLNVASTNSGTTPFYVFGAYIQDSGIPIYTSGKSTEINTAKLYTHGF